MSSLPANISITMNKIKQMGVIYQSGIPLKWILAHCCDGIFFNHSYAFCYRNQIPSWEG